jgi:hypothetical protein
MLAGKAGLTTARRLSCMNYDGVNSYPPTREAAGIASRLDM